MKVLVLHPGALGDILLSLPALALFGRSHPHVEMTLAANLDVLDAVARTVAARIVSLATLPLHRLYSSDPVPDDDLRFWRSFDRIVSWTGAGDARFEQNLARVNPRATAAAWRPEAGERRHVARIFACTLGLEPAAELEPLRLAPRHPRRELVALHPGAGSREKRWPQERFHALAKALELRGLEVVVIEGPAEEGLAARVAGGLPRVRTASGLSLAALRDLLGSCHLFVGNDSGVAHLAAAAGAQSVVLFGPTDPLHWAPLGDAVVALRDTTACSACAVASGPHTCLDNISPIQCISALGRLGLAWGKIDREK